MTRLLLIFLAVAGSAFAGSNVLLIIADDFGVDSQALYNPTAGATAPTPNLNGLAASGIRFTNAWACPVCSPTRACLITGRHGFRTGVGEAVSAAAANGLTAAELTLPEVIAQSSTASRQTACFGKWHLSTGTPASSATAPNAIGGWPHYAGATGGVLTSYTNWTKVTNGISANSTAYATTDVVNDATAWITARTNANQPWLAWVAFNAPHAPFHNPPANLHSFGANPATNLLKYRAAVEAMDTEIGHLLTSVNPATTTVIFMGDNGTPGQVIQSPYDSTHANDTLYEGGIRIPLIIRGPGITPGRTSDALVHAVDLFSTQLALAGVPLPTAVTLDSRSLVPLLTGQSTAIRSRLYTDQFDQSDPTSGGRALRDDRVKLIRYHNGTEVFHDLLTDPAESANLLANGIPAMSATHQALYYRLRFNLGQYTTAASLEPTHPAFTPPGFSLTVPETPAASQTLWQSTDLDFWTPVPGVTSSRNDGQLTFTAPHSTSPRVFYSILTEVP